MNLIIGILISLLRALWATWHTPITWVQDQPVTAILLNEQIRDNFQALYGSIRSRATLWHNQSTVLAGGAISFTLNSAQGYNGYAAQASPALNDEFTQSVVLAPGTYTLAVLGRTSPGSGLIDWYLGEIYRGSQDWYASPAVLGVIKTTSNIVISEGGRYVLRGKVASKNASSTGYLMQITKMWFQPAGD